MGFLAGWLAYSPLLERLTGDLFALLQYHSTTAPLVHQFQTAASWGLMGSVLGLNALCVKKLPVSLKLQTGIKVGYFLVAFICLGLGALGLWLECQQLLALAQEQTPV
ncbi:MAG: hypothetical protein R3194_13540, partial [Limnobacter sp.]|nr:hypothetical protein [Limnobacter sp.]